MIGQSLSESNFVSVPAFIFQDKKVTNSRLPY